MYFLLCLFLFVPPFAFSIYHFTIFHFHPSSARILFLGPETNVNCSRRGCEGKHEGGGGGREKRECAPSTMGRIRIVMGKKNNNERKPEREMLMSLTKGTGWNQVAAAHELIQMKLTLSFAH